MEFKTVAPVLYHRTHNVCQNLVNVHHSRACLSPNSIPYFTLLLPLHCFSQSELFFFYFCLNDRRMNSKNILAGQNPMSLLRLNLFKTAQDFYLQNNNTNQPYKYFPHFQEVNRCLCSFFYLFPGWQAYKIWKYSSRALGCHFKITTHSVLCFASLFYF